MKQDSWLGWLIWPALLLLQMLPGTAGQIAELLLIPALLAIPAGYAAYELVKTRPVANPQKRSWILSLIFIGGGLFFVWEGTFLWRMLSPGEDLLLSLFFGLGEFVAWIVSLVISLDHLHKSWGRAKLLSLVPLITAVAIIVSDVMFTPYLNAWYRDYLFNTNYDSYEAAVEYVLKERDEKDSQLPPKFRHLSQDGNYNFWSQGNDVNVVFFYRHGFPADADVFVYSPTGKMIPEWYRGEQKLRDNWYFVSY